jgi:hypothetical protein
MSIAKTTNITIGLMIEATEADLETVLDILIVFYYYYKRKKTKHKIGKIHVQTNKNKKIKQNKTKYNTKNTS